MRIFKPTYKDKNGKTKKVSKWWIELRDHRAKVRRFPAFTDHSQSEALGNHIQRLVNYRIIGDPPDPTLSIWLEQEAPKKLQDRFVEIGLLDARKAEAGKPLINYLPEFQQAIFLESKSSRIKKSSTADEAARTTTSRVRSLLTGCGFSAWRNVSSEKINDYIEKRPNGMSQQTAHFYVQAFRRFAKWMLDESYINSIPKINSVSVPRNYGRAFELDEFERLLEAAKTGPVRYGLTGYQRYVLYLVACETGLRRQELRALTVASVDLKNSCVFVGGENTKNKDDAFQNFTPETGQLLQEYIRGKMPNVQLFPIHDRSSKMIRADCKAAGIEVENHKGKLNFHSLRHTCGSYLAAHGVEPRIVMEIMRHKDINLTMSRYTHLLSGQKQKAINKLPRFAKPKTKGKLA